MKGVEAQSDGNKTLEEEEESKKKRAFQIYSNSNAKKTFLHPKKTKKQKNKKQKTNKNPFFFNFVVLF